ncbi:hypothetical protein GCM10027580_16410 [Corynebacterium faecale]
MFKAELIDQRDVAIFNRCFGGILEVDWVVQQSPAALVTGLPTAAGGPPGLDDASGSSGLIVK